MLHITSKAIQKELTTQMRSQLEALGYRRIRSGIFINEIKDIQRIIGFGCGKSRGRFRIWLGFRVRLPAVELILQHGENDREFGGTFGALAHVVLGSDEIDWYCDDESEIPAIAARLLELCGEGIKCMEANSSMEIVRDRIRDGSVVGYEEEQKVCIFAAMEVVLGNKAKALASLDAHIAANAGRLPKYWNSAADLRDYIASMGP